MSNSSSIGAENPPAEVTAETQPFAWSLTVNGSATVADQEKLCQAAKALLTVVPSELIGYVNFFGAQLRGDPRELFPDEVATTEEAVTAEPPPVVTEPPAAPRESPGWGTISATPSVHPTDKVPDDIVSGSADPALSSDQLLGLVQEIENKPEAERTPNEVAFLTAAKAAISPEGGS